MRDEQSLSSTRGEQIVEGTAIALSTVPYIGGPLAEIAKGFVTRRQTRRLHEFVVALASDLQRLERRIDSTLASSDDFEAFAERTFQVAEQSAQAQKLEGLRAVFLNTILSAPPQYDRGFEVVDLLLRLQPQHLTLLRIFADPVRADAEAGHVLRGLAGPPLIPPSVLLHRLLPGWEADDLTRASEVLRREALIQGSHLHAAVENRGIAVLQGRLTPFGSRVVNYLVLPG